MQGALSFSAGTAFKFSPETSRFGRKVSVSAAFVEARPMERRRSGTLYDVLRVKQDSSIREIKAAYRTLAKLYHPDVCAAAMEGKEFIEIHEAYETLSDPDMRREYDVALRRRVPVMSYQPGKGKEEGCVWTQSEIYTGRRWETDQCW